MNRYRQNWEDLAELDPFWAVLSHAERRYGHWDHEEFFRTGEREIEQLMDQVSRLALPLRRISALDFGCGVGRIAQSLMTRFPQYYGVDVSETMIRKARQFHRPNRAANFVVVEGSAALPFCDSAFDLIYTKFVLQHMPRRAVDSQIREFVRLLRVQGLLVFQLPSYISPLHRLQPRRRFYDVFRRVGVSKEFLYESLGLHPSRMTFLPEVRVKEILTSAGADLMDVEHASICDAEFESATYYATKRSPCSGGL